MLSSLLVVTLLGQSPLSSVALHRVGPIQFELPTTWRQTQRAAEGTLQFDAPDGDAYLLVDTSVVQRPGMTADECLDVMIKRLAAGPSWRRINVDVYKALQQVSFDRSPNLANTARVEQVVGCDGHISWSLVFIMDFANLAYHAGVTAHAIATLRSTGEDPNPSRAPTDVKVRNSPPPRGSR